jgi:hypothetical protein
VTFSGVPFINAPEIIGMDGAVVDYLREALKQMVRLWKKTMPPEVLKSANDGIEGMFDAVGLDSGFDPSLDSPTG